ncbi:carboxypeptidase-like regulatory domain-containing protein [Mesonia aquimarina]|uniref:carboxypeptidase-like regulatory domain-containing protein n=1 Tax=Mesonia aquimarina TaxID=1504967 RepID=UPI000EF61694|nr:carboxypeptidase-like regulatory domain-containing protein [Mesonia aquimarina]
MPFKIFNPFALNYLKPLLFFNILFCIFFLPTLCFAQQQLTGKIVDQESGKNLEGVNIYIDGSSLGTITDKEGVFKLNVEENTNALLIVRYLGYETKALPINQKGKLVDFGTIDLKLQPESIEGVVLEADPWSREKKLRYFREYFLGEDYQEKDCKILNEDKIRLRFRPSKKELKAWCEVPLQIENPYLGYIIEYSLKDFSINFTSSKRILLSGQQVYRPQTFFLSGSSYFKELKKRVRRRYIKRREETYYGSIMHFMRSLSKEKLEENDYRIFHKRYERPLYQYLKVNQKENQSEITLLKPRLTILYNNNLDHQSFVQSAYPKKDSLMFTIDNYGNFYPATLFYFGGAMGKQKVSSLLPLNYQPPD